MSKQEIRDFLSELDVCKVCILRFMNGRCEDIAKLFDEVSHIGVNRHQIQLIQSISLQFQEGSEHSNGENGTIVNDEDEPEAKRGKSNVCIACLGIFQNDTIDAAIREIIENTDLHTYECDSIYTSISVPILVQIRELSLWIALHQKFPNSISDSEFDQITIDTTY